MADFCTLFDSRFLSRGLALHASLQRFGGHRLFILPMDNLALEVLRTLDLPGVTIITLAEFEDEALLGVRPMRSAGEYCWTCTPSLIAYCLRRFKMNVCTYVDADLWFFRSPEELLDELGSRSVLLTEHRFAMNHHQAALYGRYCVQFMTFKNDALGLRALEWWRERCLEWCFARYEDGKFGDQKYLDDWTDRFEGVHVLAHLGGGVAPWNVSDYELTDQNGVLSLSDCNNGRKDPLIFYHFHALKFFNHGKIALTNNGWRINSSVRELIYKPYLAELQRWDKGLKQQFPQVDSPGIHEAVKGNIIETLRSLKQRCVGTYNLIHYNS